MKYLEHDKSTKRNPRRQTERKTGSLVTIVLGKLWSVGTETFENSVQKIFGPKKFGPDSENYRFKCRRVQIMISECHRFDQSDQI